MDYTPERASEEFHFNPFDQDFRRDPYRFYRPLFKRRPHLLQFFSPIALVARYADVAAILRDHDRFSSVPIANRLSAQLSEVFGAAETMAHSDPPSHTRLRRLVSRDFSPNRIAALEPRIREIAKDLLDSIENAGRCDLIRDYAVPLPVMVIADLLGIAGEDYPLFARWTAALIETTGLPPGAPMPAHIPPAMLEMRDYLAAEVELRRRHPGDDLISGLVAAHDAGDSLTAPELMQFLVLLLLAGSETTTNLIGNGMLALARDPHQMLLLRRAPMMMPRAVEEILRYDSPIQALYRTAKESVEIAGTRVEKGNGIFLLIGAANRDPAQFDAPDIFDIYRDPNEHLAFSEGIHFCIGARLARLEGSIALESMIERFPRLSVHTGAHPLAYKSSFFVRGLTSLPMTVD